MRFQSLAWVSFPFFLFSPSSFFEPLSRVYACFSHFHKQFIVNYVWNSGDEREREWRGKNKKNRFAIIFTLFFHAMLELTQVQWRQCCERMRIFTKWFDEFLFWSSLSRFFLNSHFSFLFALFSYTPGAPRRISSAWHTNQARKKISDVARQHWRENDEWDHVNEMKWVGKSPSRLLVIIHHRALMSFER